MSSRSDVLPPEAARELLPAGQRTGASGRSRPDLRGDGTRRLRSCWSARRSARAGELARVTEQLDSGGATFVDHLRRHLQGDAGWRHRPRRRRRAGVPHPRGLPRRHHGPGGCHKAAVVTPVWSLHGGNTGAAWRLAFRELLATRQQRWLSRSARESLLLYTGDLSLLHADLLTVPALLPTDSWAHLPPGEPYIWEQLLYHLRGAGEAPVSGRPCAIWPISRCAVRQRALRCRIRPAPGSGPVPRPRGNRVATPPACAVGVPICPAAHGRRPRRHPRKPCA